MSNLQVVFFDIDNTLLNNTRAEKKAFQVIGLEYFPQIHQREFEKQWILATKKNWRLYERKILTFQQQRIQRILDIWKYFGSSISEMKASDIFSSYLKQYEKNWKPLPYVKEIIKKLAKRGIKLGIISNGNKKQQVQKVQVLGINKYIDPTLIIVSEEVGFAKPAMEIFIYAQQKAHIPSRFIGYVGDSVHHDIISGNKMGWHTVLFDYYRLYPKEKTITSFKKLLHVLKQ